MSILETKKLTMRFGGLTAVSRFDFKVEPGKIFSIIGPNGAGKTTVFNAITGIYDPTEGSVEFEGNEVSRPFTLRVVAGCVLIGLLTAFASVLAAVKVDMLWRAAIKRQYAISPDRFSYAGAWRDAWGYLQANIAVEKQRTRWVVLTADNSGPPLGTAFLEDDAKKLKANLDEMISFDGSERTLEEREGKWVILSADRSRELASFESAEEAREKLLSLARVGRDQGSRRRTAWIAFVLGLGFGLTGSYAVWRRSRRTPDVIARGGIARTFQNIRLFQSMTVIENVLMGMDRFFSGNVPRMMLQTPGLKKEERKGLSRAQELLEFVGLSSKANMLAKELPYGDQRRLEIARALATKPRLLLLDEPAAGMNPFETGELIKLIRKIRDEGITVLLIEHHMNVVMGISDRIAVLDYGVKIAEGTPAEIKGNPKVIEAYLGKEEVS